MIKHVGNKILKGQSVSYDEIFCLQENQEKVKKLFPNEPIVWEWAGIPEEQWRNK